MRLMTRLCFCFFIILVLAACQPLQTTDDSGEKKIRAARINTQLAVAYLKRHEITRAKQKLILAMEEGPSLPEVWYTTAYFLEATGNKDKARQHYLKAIDLASERGDVHNNYGTFLCRNGKYKEAIHQFLLAIQDINYLDPAAAYENAGLCSLKIPDTVRAQFYFKKSLIENPNRPTSLIELAELNYRIKKIFTAKKLLDQFHRLSPPTPQSTNLMEKIYARL